MQPFDPNLNDLPHELATAIRDCYLPAGLIPTHAPQREQESGEYGACRFELGGHIVVFRVAKTTPTKIGQFVTLWKRPAPGEAIAPLDSSDGVSHVVVSASDATYCGQFVFTQQTLLKHGVMSRDGHGGKRAIRVYPPWTTPVAKDAIWTQQWQLPYFVMLTPQDGDAVARLRQLFQA